MVDIAGHRAKQKKALQKVAEAAVAEAQRTAAPVSMAPMNAFLTLTGAETLSLRTGYKLNYDVEAFTFGAGVKTDLDPVRLNVDYSYGGMGEYLDGIHRITIGARLR